MKKLYTTSVLFMLLFIGIVQLQVLNKISQLTPITAQQPEQVAESGNTEFSYEHWQPTVASQLSEADRKFISDTIKNIVKTEIANLPGLVAAGHPNTVEDQPLASTTQSVESFEYSRVILDQAIARGGWTQSDAAKIAPYLTNLTVTQRDALSLKFVESINNGQIDLKSMDKGIFPF